MSLVLTGRVIQIFEGSQTNRTTGEIRPKYAAEILHTVRGRSVVENLNIDLSIHAEWSKAVNHEISIEVKPYAMKSDDGSILSGLTLAQKGALPVIHKPKSAA